MPVNNACEIRRILLGQTVQTEDGSLAAPKPGARVLFRGMVNGWGAVRFFGITHRVRCYRMGGGISLRAADKILSRMGRKVALSEGAQVSACLCQSPMASPVLLTVEQEGNKWTVTAFTGRSPMAALHCRRVLNRFARGLPEGTVQIEQQSDPGKAKAPRPKRPGAGKRKPGQPEQKGTNQKN